MRRNMIIEIISSMLVALFSYTAISKLVEFKTFTLQLSKSPFITQFSGLLAFALPIIELGAVGLLLLNKTRSIGLYASFGLMSLFTAYVYAMLHFSYDLPCSCGGVLSIMSWQQHLIFNVVFTLLSMVAAVLQKKKINSLDASVIS